MKRNPLLIASLIIATLFQAHLLHLRQGHRIPSEALLALEKDPNPVLYSLYPYREFPRLLPDGKMEELGDRRPMFHDFRILGQTTVSAAESRRLVVGALRDSFQNWSGLEFECRFSPRHGIRVFDGSVAYDFVVCFQCGQMLVYTPNLPRKETGLWGSAKPLNDILAAANVPLPPQ